MTQAYKNLTGDHELIEPEESVPKHSRKETEANRVSGRLPGREVCPTATDLARFPVRATVRTASLSQAAISCQRRCDYQ